MEKEEKEKEYREKQKELNLKMRKRATEDKQAEIFRDEYWYYPSWYKELLEERQKEDERDSLTDDEQVDRFLDALEKIDKIKKKYNIQTQPEDKVEEKEEEHRTITNEERLKRAKAELEFMRKHPWTKC